MNIGIIGCAGRMGRILTATVLETDGAELAGGTEQANSQFIGEDVAALAGCEPRGTAVGENPMELFEVSGAVVDFTAPAGTVGHARLAAESGTTLVIGTTGLDAADMDAIKIASKKTTIVQASNMSLGVNLLLGLVETVARSLGEEYDIEIVEIERRYARFGLGSRRWAFLIVDEPLVRLPASESRRTGAQYQVLHPIGPLIGHLVA